ncbi:quinon protein alcohol dehydrogenase-like superfamily [Hygrophoropsis aurantiaca]|uniref:Quinon protein alcohol dehydrogenase-like superfamily n=1 Tax=Hygrophoropsis aurantiaca TaxID=72124 RepID=A0ACB7ZXF7_9AGAM|nr:quinon protein alcohol dehydrogenase-like superfamily [Hygrophoropsis aurantiaca]
MSTSASPELEDPAPRLPTKVFEGHTNEVWSVAYFHDGKRIISGSYDKTVRIWDVESEKQVGESLMHDFGVRSVALFPDERRLVSGGDGVVLWDLEGRTVMWKKEKSEVDGQCVTYSSDGRLVAASHNLAIVLLNAETGEQIRDPLQLGGTVLCLAFSPDGTQLAAGSGSGDAARVRVFDVATGETVVSPFKAHPSIVMALVYILDGQQFTTASYDKSIRVWDAATGQQLGDPILGHEDWVHQIALSRDGQRITSSSQDSTVRVWDLKRRRQAGASLRTQDNLPFVSVGWSPDGRSIVGGSTVNIYLWDVPQFDDHTTIPRAPAPTTSIAPLLPSTSRPRASSISSSILNLHAGSQRPNQTSATDRLADDFFDFSPDLPTLAQPQLPGLTRTTPTANLPTRISEDARPAPRFEKLARMRRQMSTIAQRTHKAARKTTDEPRPLRDNHNATRETQSFQAHAGKIFSAQGINPKPSPRRPRHARRNDEIGMIAPAPGYDRYHSATEEYWYDPQNPPLIDRIFFCMICCGVPKDDANIKCGSGAQCAHNQRSGWPIPFTKSARSFRRSYHHICKCKLAHPTSQRIPAPLATHFKRTSSSTTVPSTTT